MSEHGTTHYERGLSRAPHRMDPEQPVSDAGVGLPGGVWDMYDMSGRVVCPDSYVRYPNQIGETEFLFDLSRRLQDRLLPVIGQEVTVEIPQMIKNLRKLVRGGENPLLQPLDPWLGQQLGLPVTSTPQDYYDALLQLVDAASLPTLFQAVELAASMTPEGVRPLVDSDNGAEKSGSDVGAAFPPDILAVPPPPLAAVTPTSSDGGWVHWVIQVHYLLSHPGHWIVLDDRLARVDIVDGNWSVTMRHLTEAVGLNVELVRVYMALQSQPESHRYTRWPDILDVELGEVYEIKPRNGWSSGRGQLKEYLDILQQVFPPTVSVKQFRAGSSWTASRLYPIPPDKFALVFQPENGLIIYDLVQATSPHPSTVPVTEIAWGAALVVCAVATAAMFVSGGATAPMAAWAARAALTALAAGMQ